MEDIPVWNSRHFAILVNTKIVEPIFGKECSAYMINHSLLGSGGPLHWADLGQKCANNMENRDPQLVLGLGQAGYQHQLPV